jgi:hypothetical protein
MNQICKFFGATSLCNSSNSQELQVLETSFMNHISEYGLTFATKQEYDFRFNMYAEMDAELEKINTDPENTFSVAHNMFSHMTAAERKQHLGRLSAPHMPERVSEEFAEPSNDSVDWRT